MGTPERVPLVLGNPQVYWCKAWDLERYAQIIHSIGALGLGSRVAGSGAKQCTARAKTRSFPEFGRSQCRPHNFIGTPRKSIRDSGKPPLDERTLDRKGNAFWPSWRAQSDYNQSRTVLYFPDPQRDLKIRSPGIIWDII